MDFTILGFGADFNLILKIFFVLAIIAFIRQKVTHNKFALFLITISIVAMVFLFWPLFRTAYIIYTLLAIGVAGILVDFFFISAGGSAEEMMGNKMNTHGTPGGLEHRARDKAMQSARKRPGRWFFMMGQRGGIFSVFKGVPLLAKILIVTVLAVLIVPGAMIAFPIVKYVIMAILVFFIYENTSQAIGNNVLTFIITGVLSYFLIYKYLYLTASLMMFYLFLGFGLVSVFFWGTSTLSRKK